MVKQQTLILIRGLDGSGKTTLANLICKGIPSARCKSVCVYDYLQHQDLDSFDGQMLKDAHTWCKTTVAAWMEDQCETIVVHNNLTRKWECEPYLELGMRHGYEVMVVNLFDGGLNDHQLAQRSKGRVPIGSIRAQRNRWHADVFRSEKPTLRKRRIKH
tara:strand:- start:2484 stop:2960 length:477 start_codon:yes stop_codon:yes gene_type:complete